MDAGHHLFSETIWPLHVITIIEPRVIRITSYQSHEIHYALLCANNHDKENEIFRYNDNNSIKFIYLLSID